MASKLYYNPFVPAFSNTGVAIARAKLYFYYTGTTTLAPIYADSALTVPLANPVKANLAGKYVNIYYDSSITYRVRQTDKNDAPIGDDVDPYIPGAVGSDVISFIQSGTGAVARTMQSKAREVVSVKDFGAVADGVTDDYAAFAAAVAYMRGKGGTIMVPRGKYFLGSQIVIDRTYGTDPDGGFIGERSMLISGFGAEIISTGAFTPFKIVGGWAPNISCIVEGLTINHRAATLPTGAFLCQAASYVRFRFCTVLVNGGLPATYYGWRLEQSDPNDTNTGCFWGVIEDCNMRPWAGADGYAGYGAQLIGSANATTIKNNSFGGAGKHIQIAPHTGKTVTANAVRIEGNAFEGPITSIGIEVNGGTGAYHTSGLRITHNRFESVATAITFIGTAANIQIPAFIAGNCADGSVTNYLVNTSGVKLNFLDAAHVGSNPPAMVLDGSKGIELRCEDSAYDTAQVYASAAGKGLTLRSYIGTFLGRWKSATVAGGNGSVFGGSYSGADGYHPMALTSINGLSTRDTPANNMAGAVSLSAATSQVVNFGGGAEPDTNYYIWLTGETNAVLWVSGRTTSGFTINASAPVTGNVGWLLVRLN